MDKIEAFGCVANRVNDGLYQSEYGEFSVERQDDGEWLASYFQIDCHVIVPGLTARDAAARLALVVRGGIDHMRAVADKRTDGSRSN